MQTGSKWLRRLRVLSRSLEFRHELSVYGLRYTASRSLARASLQPYVFLGLHFGVGDVVLFPGPFSRSDPKLVEHAPLLRLTMSGVVVTLFAVVGGQSRARPIVPLALKHVCLVFVDVGGKIPLIKGGGPPYLYQRSPRENESHKHV